MSAISASEFFDQLDRHTALAIERHEVGSAGFSTFRKNLYILILKLLEAETLEATSASSRIRALLSMCLTTPLAFDMTVIDRLSEVLGPRDSIGTRWGQDVKSLYESSYSIWKNISLAENPLCARVRDVVESLHSQNLRFKIYCHRSARELFYSAVSTPQHSEFLQLDFLHSLRDYRESEIFDSLVKVGPLRSRGWSSAPDALLTAPRFSSLLQIVWSGCNDEPDFGYDPADSSVTQTSEPQSSTTAVTSPNRNSLVWSRRVISHHAENIDQNLERVSDIDELHFLGEMARAPEMRAALLIHLNSTYGMLYPAHSEIITFDPHEDSIEPVDLKTPGDSSLEGMFIVRPNLTDIDLGVKHAGHGRYSDAWKARLIEEYEADPIGLIDRLRAGGLNLINLAAAINHWCAPPTTVIHAPQQIRHFEILLDALDFTEETARFSSKNSQLWKRAWNEIRRSRGEAIQAGFVENEIVVEQLLTILREFLQEMRISAAASDEFNFVIPDSYGINGVLNIFRVRGVEGGFCAPSSDLKVIYELSTIDQWRV